MAYLGYTFYAGVLELALPCLEQGCRVLDFWGSKVSNSPIYTQFQLQFACSFPFDSPFLRGKGTLNPKP